MNNYYSFRFRGVYGKACMTMHAFDLISEPFLNAEGVFMYYVIALCFIPFSP